MNNSVKCVVIVAFAINMALAIVSPASITTNSPYERSSLLLDYDPLVNIELTVDVLSIRALDKIDDDSDPDFFLVININDREFVSPTWNNIRYLYHCWNVTADIPDDEEFVAISITLYDYNTDGARICDISPYDSENVQTDAIHVEYNIKTGHWIGDDQLGDASGYGRVSGCDDGSIYENERDCEIFFNIYQSDYDGDNLPFWIETNKYGTDPFIDNRYDDYDNDSIPLYWEHYWGYDPLTAENHLQLDDDNDSITNYEEFLTSAYGADPFRKDLFLEIDFMNRESRGKTSSISEKATELFKNPFHRRNIVVHVETGDIVPFDDFTDQNELLDLYHEYFKQSVDNNWKRAIFHYGLFVHNCVPTGFSFAGDGPVVWGYLPGTNAFVVSASMMERYQLVNQRETLDWFHASVIMHEMGHNFGIRYGYPPGCDNQNTKYPWQLGWYLYRNYESIMNYRYTYEIFDYSDGSHGNRDFDDWSNINLSYFELPSSPYNLEMNPTRNFPDAD